MNTSLPSENQIWKAISTAWPGNTSGWVSGGSSSPWTYSSGTFDFASTQNGGVVNNSTYFTSSFNTNSKYDYCAIRVTVKDSLGAINSTKFVSNNFVVDYRENPNNVSWAVSNPIVYTLANSKSGLVNSGTSITLNWQTATDRNSGSTVPAGDPIYYEVYLSMNGGTYSKNQCKSNYKILIYSYTVPSVSLNTTIAFKIVAVDSTD